MEIEEYQTTTKDYEYFCKCATVYLRMFNLRDWEVDYKHLDEPGARAWVIMDVLNHVATIGLSVTFDHKPAKAELKRCALHEVLHILFNPVVMLAKDKNFPDESLDKEIHSIIRMFENHFAKEGRSEALDD